MSDDFFDFGFTAVDESELEAVQKATNEVSQVTSTVETTQEKLDKLYNAITPLLNNLKNSLPKLISLMNNQELNEYIKTVVSFSFDAN